MARADLPKDAGLSLMEVLTALAVIAILTGAVIVSMGSRPSETRQAADQLITRLAEAREFALVSGETIGFAADFDQRGWRFFHATDGLWEVMGDHPALGVEPLPRGVSIYVAEGALPRREDDETSEAPQVFFDPTGFDQPFAYIIRSDEDRFTVLRDERGELRLVTDGAGAPAS